MAQGILTRRFKAFLIAWRLPVARGWMRYVDARVGFAQPPSAGSTSHDLDRQDHKPSSRHPIRRNRAESNRTAGKLAAALAQPSSTPGPQMDIRREAEPFVDAARAGEFLSLRPRRVLELARKGVIPAYPLGNGQRRVWRFRLSELASAMLARIHCARQSPAPRRES